MKTAYFERNKRFFCICSEFSAVISTIITKNEKRKIHQSLGIRLESQGFFILFSGGCIKHGVSFAFWGWGWRDAYEIVETIPKDLAARGNDESAGEAMVNTDIQ